MCVDANDVNFAYNNFDIDNVVAVMNNDQNNQKMPRVSYVL